MQTCSCVLPFHENFNLNVTPRVHSPRRAVPVRHRVPVHLRHRLRPSGLQEQHLLPQLCEFAAVYHSDHI